MLLRESILEHIDYNVREPVRLLNMFNGVDTSQSCSGHIQEGDTRNERAIRYIPGLKRVAVSIRNVDNGNSLDIVPEHYELNGKEIDIEEFIRGAFCHHDDLIISPLDDIQSHKHENLSFTGLHLLFSRFECKDNKTRELKKRLHMIYNETEAIDIRHGQWRYDGDGVCFSAAGCSSWEAISSPFRI